MESLTIPAIQGYTQPKSDQTPVGKHENISNYVNKLISENEWMHNEQCTKITDILLRDNQLFLSKMENKNTCYTIDGDRKFSYNASPDLTSEVAIYIKELTLKCKSIGIDMSSNQVVQLLETSNALYGFSIMESIQANLNSVLERFATEEKDPIAEKYYCGLHNLAKKLHKLSLYRLGVECLHLSGNTIDTAIETYKNDNTSAAYNCLLQWTFAQEGKSLGQLSSALKHALQKAGLGSCKDFFPGDHHEAEQEGPTLAHKPMDSVLFSLARHISNRNMLLDFVVKELGVDNNSVTKQLGTNQEIQLAAFGALREWDRSQTEGHDTKINALKEALKKMKKPSLVKTLTQ